MRKHSRFPLLVLPLALLAACAGLGGESAKWPYATLSGERPLLIAHRGASGVLPEHTIEGYKRAIADGADCIEPDLVLSKDGVLIDRHDTFLSTTTDIAGHAEFAGRKRPSPDPEFSDREDWWVADFTLAELKTLRAIQSFRGRSKEFDGLYAIPTFDEVLALTRASRSLSGKAMCVYPEAKSPAYHAQIGQKDMAEKILAGLKAHGLSAKGSPVFIQSFEPDFVQKIQPMTELPVILLAGDKASLDTAMKMPGAPFWQGLGVTHQMLFNTDGSSSGLIRDAHARGIAVHTWTYRDDARYRDPPFNSEPIETSERHAFEQGLDGFFTDFPATGYRVRGEVEAGAR